MYKTYHFWTEFLSVETYFKLDEILLAVSKISLLFLNLQVEQVSSAFLSFLESNWILEGTSWSHQIQLTKQGQVQHYPGLYPVRFRIYQGWEVPRRSVPEFDCLPQEKSFNMLQLKYSYIDLCLLLSTTKKSLPNSASSTLLPIRYLFTNTHPCLSKANHTSSLISSHATGAPLP